MNAEVQAEKRRQRIAATKAREALSASEREVSSRIVSDKLAAHPAVAGASVILSYMAFGPELDLTLFHEEMTRRGKVLAFPVTLGKGCMEAYRAGGEEDWTVGAYGILTPKEAPDRLIAPESIDIVVVPCLAFDKRCMRLGWGAGYYDRYLRRCRKALAIGAAFEVQRVDEIAADPDWDVRLDEVITEGRNGCG